MTQEHRRRSPSPETFGYEARQGSAPRYRYSSNVGAAHSSEYREEKRESPHQSSSRAQKSRYEEERSRSAPSPVHHRINRKMSISSPEKRRLLGKYEPQTRQLKRDLDLARLTSQAIRSAQADLSTELKAFSHKLTQHHDCKRGERAIMSACQSELSSFQHRMREAKMGLDEASQSDGNITVDSTWEEFSDVRGVMLTNLKLLHDAQDMLSRERNRLDREDVEDGRKLREIKHMIADMQRDHPELYQHDSDSRRRHREMSSPRSSNHRSTTMDPMSQYHMI